MTYLPAQRKWFSIWLALASFLICSSCKDEATQPPSGNVADFPNKPGSQWTYSFYDSVAQRSDTVVVSIVDKTTIPGNKLATVWQRVFRNRIDTLYITIAADTVRVIPKVNLSSQWVNTKYIFPLVVGKGWRGDFVNDTSTVVDNMTVSVFAGIFPNTFLIDERWGAFNDYGSVLTWFVPKVGVIKLFRREWGFGDANETWELISYRVSP